MTKKYNAKEVFQKEMLESILTSLEQEIIPWEKPWDNFLGLPMNAVTGKPYNGSNSYNLMFSGLAQGFTDPRWCTFKQAKEKGWSVKKGSKSTKVFFVSLIDKRTNKPVTSKNYKGLTKEESEILKENTIPVFKNYSVFNAEQINDIPELDKNLLIRNTFKDEKTEKYLDNLIKGMNLPLTHEGDKAFYVPAQDRVQLPPKESFKSYQGYVETYLHEVTHATGHKSRLDRDLTGSFGTGSYAKEELVADISSMMLAIDLGIITSERQIDNTKAYCQNWHEQLKNNPKILPEVIESMNKARNYMHEKGNWIFEEIKAPLEVNIDTLSASVKIEDYAEQVLGLSVEPHSKNLKRLVEHDSCIIYPDTNSYFRYSSQRGGNIYEFIMEFENLDFKQALEKVKEFYNDFKPELLENNTVKRSSTVERNLELPERSYSTKQGFDYLTKERGLSKELVEDMFDRNYIFQDDKNNVVFLGYENGTPAYASKRSTYSDFKGDVSGSRKEVGFFINNNSDTLVISESPIDSLSILDMQDSKTNHLGTGGVGASISCFKYFVENNPTANNTNNIILSFDNDEAGINAAETLSGYIKGYYPYYNVDIQYPKNKDFNLDLIDKKKNQEELNLSKYTLNSSEPFDSNFHENYYRIDNNEDNSIYGVRLPKNLDIIDNIYAYKVDTTGEEVSLDRGKKTSHEELKEIADFLNNNKELNITLPQHLLNRLETNLDDEAPFYLDSVEKMKGSDNDKEYDFTRYNLTRGSKEYSLNIDSLDDSVGGTVIKYGGWYDLMATEKKEILDFLIKYELSLEPISNESKLMVNKELLEENSPEQLFTDVPAEKTKREEFIDSIKVLLEDDELMANGSPEEIIYSIDDINVYGGFEMGIRSVDHNILLSDDVSWEDIMNWGTVVVPEEKTYIASVQNELFEDLNYQRLGLNNNHIAGFKDIDENKEVEIPKEFSFFKSPNDSSFVELEAIIRYEDELLSFTANGIEFATADFDDYNIDNDVIYNIFENNSDDITNLQNEVLYDVETKFNELKILDINEEPVAYQNEEKIWLEQGVFSLDDKDIENKILDLMNDNLGKYKFTDDSLKEHFETLQSELLEDLKNIAIKDQETDEYFADNYGDNYDSIKDEVISLIKKYELGESTTWKKVLQVYLDQQVSWNNMNEFANHFFREIGANITTPITSLSFEENRSTLNVYLDDELSDEDYLAIINFNLSPSDVVSISDESITITTDETTLEAKTLKDMYEQQGFKDLLINDFKILGLTELEHSSLFKNNDELMRKLMISDNSYSRAFAEATKERDLDNDGIPDRIDIDDTRNAVQSIEDMSDEPKKARGMSL